MEVARSGAGGKREIDLARLVDERLRHEEVVARARRVSVHREGGARVSCRSDIVARVVGNLVTNAIEASPEGGTVRVRIETDREEVRIVVADQGAGVPKEREHELFEPFFTLKPEGTGLGLFLSRALLVAQGGRLAYGRDASTTLFTVALPLGPAESVEAVESVS